MGRESKKCMVEASGGVTFLIFRRQIGNKKGSTPVICGKYNIGTDTSSGVNYFDSLFATYNSPSHYDPLQEGFALQKLPQAYKN